MKSFMILWTGQLFSRVGTQLTAFALGVWVYMANNSVTEYGLILFCGAFPGVILSPLAGVMVDRMSRQRVLIFSDLLAGVGSIFIFWQIFSGNLQIWHVYAVTCIASAADAFQWPAYSASVTQLVDKEYYAKAGGLNELSLAVAQLIGPPLAGVLLKVIEMKGIIALDLATFGVAVFTLFMIRIPDHRDQSAKEDQPKTSMLEEAKEGWQYLISRRGLVLLLVAFVISNFLIGLLTVMATPYILTFSTPAVLGILLAAGGIGMAAGSVLMSTWGGPAKHINGVFLFQVLSAIAAMMVGFSRNIYAIGACSFFFFASIPLVLGCSQAIWQKKVAAEIQGRVFSLRKMLAFSAAPIAYLLAGPLADKVFEPMMSNENSLLGGLLGPVTGIGPGYGIGAMFILMGATVLIFDLILFQLPALKNLERDLPDVT